MACVICERYRGERPNERPIGGYVYQDDHWYAYHAPIAKATLGQLFLVSTRHFLDYAEMTADEAQSYGVVLRRLVAALKDVVQAERVYTLVTLEGIPHFHVWLIPRYRDQTERGWSLITRERSCSEADALAVVTQLREALAEEMLHFVQHDKRDGNQTGENSL